MPTDELASFCCQNPDCQLYGKRGQENLLVIDHFGKSRHRLLYGKICKDRFSEFKGDTVLQLQAVARQGLGGLGAHHRGMRRPADRGIHSKASWWAND
jgi:hypothetical protein